VLTSAHAETAAGAFCTAAANAPLRASVRRRMRAKARPLTAPPDASTAERSRILEEAYERYLPYVAKMGFRLLGRPDEVDDLIQDVFVAAAERLPYLREPGALKGWLASITVRTALKKLRRRRLRRMLSLSDEPISARDVSGFVNPGAPADVSLLLVQVFRILDTVPARERLAWSLRVLEEEPLEVVAELCGCSLSTVKRRVAMVQGVIDREVRS